MPQLTFFATFFPHKYQIQQTQKLNKSENKFISIQLLFFINWSKTNLFSAFDLTNHYILLSYLKTLYKNMIKIHKPKIIKVSLENLNKHKQILEWRKNTNFPIVKIKSYTFLQKKHHFRSSFLQILVQLESQMTKFNDIKKLPIFQVIYVLKESIIGFERLCHHFGFFKISPEMVMFNQSQNCKVWIAKQWYSNQIEPSSIKSEKEFIFELCDIVEKKAVKSKISLEFFERIKNCKHFFEAIGSIENFAKANKIKIPSKLQNLDGIKSQLLKPQKLMDTKMSETKNNYLVAPAKIPHFIKNVQVKKLVDQQIYTPLLKKNSIATQFCAYNRSSSNIIRNHSTNSFLRNDYSDKKIKERDNTFDEEDFPSNFNIRLIEPNGEENKTTKYSLNFSEKYALDTPESQFSPLRLVSQINWNEDKKYGLSFNEGTKRQDSSSFDASERMILTVCKSATGNGVSSRLKKAKSLFSAICIRSLQYFSSQNVESLQEFQTQVKSNTFMPIIINQIKDKRRLSANFGNQSIQLDQEQRKNDEKRELFTPVYRNTNILNVPRQSHNGLAKSPSHLNICKILRKKQQIQLEEEQREQQERQFLRQNIMNINGWKGLSILQKNIQIQKSYVDQNQQISIKRQVQTSELPKLRGMGRVVQTSMIEDFEFELQYGNQLEKSRSVRNQFIGLLQ